MLLNPVGAIVWATAVGIGVHFFENALETVKGGIKHYEAVHLALLHL